MQGKIDDAMKMYQELHKWNLSVKVAEARNHPDLENLKRNYMQWLTDSGQEDKAGACFKSGTIPKIAFLRYMYSR